MSIARFCFNPLESPQPKLLNKPILFSPLKMVFRGTASVYWIWPMVITEPAVPRAQLLGQGSKLYPSKVQWSLNKDLTRFTQSLCRVRQGCAGADWIHVGSLLPYLVCAYRVEYMSKKAQTQTRLTSDIFEAVFSPQLSCYENPTAFLHYARIWKCRIKGAMSRG